MGIFNKKTTEHRFSKPSDAKVGQCWSKGNAITKASLFVFGLGNLLNKQIVRGLAFLAIEIGYLVYMITFGIGAIGDMITLGTAMQEEVWDAELGIYTYKANLINQELLNTRECFSEIWGYHEFFVHLQLSALRQIFMN